MTTQQAFAALHRAAKRLQVLGEHKQEQQVLQAIATLRFLEAIATLRAAIRGKK